MCGRVSCCEGVVAGGALTEVGGALTEVEVEGGVWVRYSQRWRWREGCGERGSSHRGRGRVWVVLCLQWCSSSSSASCG